MNQTLYALARAFETAAERSDPCVKPATRQNGTHQRSRRRSETKPSSGRSKRRHRKTQSASLLTTLTGCSKSGPENTAAIQTSRGANQKDTIMALKPRVRRKAKGIPIGSYEEIRDAAGKQLIKPKRKHKTLQQEYASRNRKRYKGVAK